MSQPVWWQALVTRLGPDALASPPAVWGKLADHGDFVSHRCSAAERAAWQSWAESSWPQPEQRPTRRRKQPTPSAGWVHLQPAEKAPAEALTLPVAFVLPLGAMAFAPRHFVQGVALASEDRFGRSCPFIIYQRVSPAWFRRLWGDGQSMGGRDLLYWWARLAVSAVHGHVPWTDWLPRLDTVWTAHAPRWAHRFGRAPDRPADAAMWSAIGPLGADDPAGHCTGVAHQPWLNWPRDPHGPARVDPAFWTQDEAGGYVQAGRSLAGIGSLTP